MVRAPPEEASRKIAKHGAAGVCAVLALRLGMPTSPAWVASARVRPVGLVGVSPTGASPQRELSQKAASYRASAERFAAPAAVLAGVGGATGSRRRFWARSSRKASADDDEVRRLPTQPAASQAAAVASSDKGGDGGWLEKFQKDPELQEDLKTFFQSLAFALTIRFTIVEPRFIPSLSMYPNFDIGDQLTVDKISKNWRNFQRRDVVVFNPPPAFFESLGEGVNRNGEALIKRIVALEGDTVEMKQGGKLYINGELQDEPFTNEAAKYTFPQRKVPPGCVLVLGDNRNQSLDGHVWGWLPVENIIGRATFKFWPPWHVGGIQASPP